MKKILKILGILAGVLVIVVIGAAVYLQAAFPKIGEAPEIDIEATQARLERGEYLVTKVMACLHCHSDMDDKTFGKPPVPGTEGAGGEKFDESLRFPGTFYAKNITPAALGDWTDGETIRAIASGVSYNFYRSTGRRRPALV